MGRRTEWPGRLPRQWSTLQDSWQRATRWPRPAEEYQGAACAWRNVITANTVLAGTQSVSVAYELIDAFLQPMRHTGRGGRRVLRPLWSSPAFRRRAAP